MRAVVNGKLGEIFDGVSLQSLKFSADGRRFSYFANDRSVQNRWFCVIDGEQRNAFDSLGVSFAFSPDGRRVAYTGRREQQWFLATDEKDETPIAGIVDHTLTFSPDSRRLAYAVAKLDTRSHIVVDGEAGPIYDGIGWSQPPGMPGNSLGGFSHGVLFSPDSRRLAYLASKQLVKKIVVVDGKPDEIEMASLVGGMVFSDDSKRLAYGGRKGSRFFLVVDGKKGTDYEALGCFGFSEDGKHIAFTAKKGDKMVVVVDGRECAQHTAVPAGPVFRSDGVLEYLAADEPSLYRIEVKDL